MARIVVVGVGVVVAIAAASAMLHEPSGPSAPEYAVADDPAPAAAIAISDLAGAPTGRIDTITASDADTLIVAGWSTDRAGLAIDVDARSVRIDDVHRRYDVEAATGTPAWGFSVELATPEDATLCLRASGRDLDCQPWRCDPRLFAARFVRDLREDYPGQRFTAHVKDTRTGCAYELKPDLVMTTASVIKVEILGGLLLEAQTDRRDLTATERALANDMMNLSLNGPTSRLWLQLGGVAGMNALDDAFGVTETVHSPGYGATSSTASDRTEVTLAVLHGGGPLDNESTELAWTIMAGVHPAQQWGVSAGVAEGYRVANKNGFYPLTGSGWRVGSTGFVADPTGGGYALTIMTDNNRTQADGVDLVETIARRINTRLTSGRVGARPFDEITCITHNGNQTWRALARALDLPAAVAEEVRLAAGGDGPMWGQLVCTP